MRLAILFVAIGIVAAAHEQVWLRQVNRGPGRRNLDSSSFEFELKRSSGTTRLNLVENKRLNANAPTYNVVDEGNGKKRLVRKTGVPVMKTRFFKDKANQGAFKMTFEKSTNRPVISGNFLSGNESLSLAPAPLLIPVPSKFGKGGEEDAPYVLHAQTHKKAPAAPKPDAADHYDDDFIETTDNEETVDDSKKSLDTALKRIQYLLNKKQQIQAKKARTRRSNPVYALELIVATDPTIWNKQVTADSKMFNQMATAGDGLTRDQVTELLIKEHFVHIVQGMSLRYEAIEDPAMNIYLTISGFIIYDTFNNSNPLSPAQGNVELVEVQDYLYSVRDWAATLSNPQHDDHILVFTDYELYSGSPDNKGVAGMAFVGATCSASRVSINEDGSYFTTVSVAAHELGHNLGSSHDGSSGGCYVSDKYIMAPSVTNFLQGDPYTPNPWMFSSCSVAAFKTYVSSLGGNNCLLDTGNYYDVTEYNDHASQLPGMLHTADEQCQLERGEGSYLDTYFTKPTNEDFCRRIACYYPVDGYSYFHTPARGTDCGESGSNKYCIDGQCVDKSDEHIQGAHDEVDNDVTGDTGTDQTGDQGSTYQGTTDQEGCVDIGYNHLSCSQVADIFMSQTPQVRPDQWCMDPSWEAICCDFCEDAESNTPTTTTQAPASGECVDLGYEQAGWSCAELDAYFTSKYGAPTTALCYDPNWYPKCCQFCAAHGILTPP